MRRGGAGAHAWAQQDESVIEIVIQLLLVLLLQLLLEFCPAAGQAPTAGGLS